VNLAGANADEACRTLDGSGFTVFMLLVRQHHAQAKVRLRLQLDIGVG
jgi:hypothetical protein